MARDAKRTQTSSRIRESRAAEGSEEEVDSGYASGVEEVLADHHLDAAQTAEAVKTFG